MDLALEVCFCLQKLDRKPVSILVFMYLALEEPLYDQRLQPCTVSILVFMDLALEVRIHAGARGT